MSPTSHNGNTVRSPRKGARVGPVSESSVFLKVKPASEEVIREALNLNNAADRAEGQRAGESRAQ